MRLKQGFIQIYTGDGKGKTTASLGLAMRAAGAGLKVYIGQFMKSKNYSEIKALSAYNGLITVEQFGAGRCVGKKISEEDKKHAQNGIQRVKEIVQGNCYGVVILDEINVVLSYGLVDIKEVIDILRNKPDDLEMVLTGRRAHDALIEISDLVTEMREIKHYYKKGIKARVGIEK
ncbi:MAG: cob(I)yrinic acid a,c-diamide adenosyltransferase [Candidatus Omnitrophota bacterium]|nr:cob(I)yrinic acid a,c-diamide adenosyltransferase [Candidatus Omnitrophota bacterium]